MDKPRILLIDDNTTYHQQFITTFNRHYEIISIYSVDEAERQVSKDFYDLVIIDLELDRKKEGLEGLELVNQFYAKTFSPILIITNYIDDIPGRGNLIEKEVIILKKEEHDIKWVEIFQKAQNKKKATVFISHTSEDSGFAGWLKECLSNEKFRILMKEAKPGDYVLPTIAENIGNSDYFLAIISPNAVTCNNFNYELQQALSSKMTKKTQIIPIMYHNCELPNELNSITPIKFFENHNSFKINLKGLIQTLSIKSSTNK